MSTFGTFAGRSAVVVALTCSLATIGGTAHAATEVSACAGVPATGELTVQQLPEGSQGRSCDLTGRVVVHGGVGVAIPAPGEQVMIEALRADHAEGHTLSVAVTPEGDISYQLPEPEAGTTGESAVQASPGACSDNVSLPKKHDVVYAYEWYIGDGGMPGALSQANARTAFADAINNITMGYNNCGIADTIDAHSDYIGTTTYEADITSSTTCSDRDGKGTWDAGNLSSGVLAATCSWTTSSGSGWRSLVEADVRYNTTDFDFTNSPSSSCSSLYDVRAVGTHEAGHVFGLGHAPDSGHDNLTMAPTIDACNTSDRTLGRGDMTALEAIY